MSDYSTQAAEKAAAAIRGRSDVQPTIGIILGSGLGGLSKKIDGAVRIPFRDIPGFPEVTIVGHEGAVITGTLGGRPVVALSGRFHVYEGHSAALAAFPVRVFRALGAQDLFVSNAAGGISPKLAVGDLMMISDHLNLMGTNPLIGALEKGDTRFPDMTDAYDPRLRRILRTTAENLGIVLREGVYAAVLGPSYETPAEVKMLRMLGADAVGMSTVPEAIAARHQGMRILGISCITNLGAGMVDGPIDHGSVMETGARVAEVFKELLKRTIVRI